MLEVSEYFERLDVSAQTQTASVALGLIRPTQSIQSTLRSSLAQIRHSRIAPSSINAPPPGFIPPTLGVGLPNVDGTSVSAGRGLNEERVERDAWQGVLEALLKLKAARALEEEDFSMDVS